MPDSLAVPEVNRAFGPSTAFGEERSLIRSNPSPCLLASVVNHAFQTMAGQRWRLRGVACLVLLIGLTGQACALEVRQVRWGFNGAVKQNAFNLCSIDLNNPTPDPFQGPVQLKPSGGIGGGDDTPWTELNLYVGPGETRTVQFMPFVTSQAPDWEVSWGASATEHFNFPHSNREIPSQVAVQFIAAQGVSSPLKGIEAFLEDDFPIGSPGTEVLGSVVLDHVPRRWDVVRNRAFRDWLGRGGRLYLIHDRDGKPLQFPSPLEELNVPADRFSVGQGTVIRQSIVQDAGEIPGLVSEISQSAFDPNNPTANIDYSSNPALEGMTQLFQTMRSMVRPDHNWTLIFFLALIYLLILFPGIWFISRKRGDFRITYALILGTVVVFSWFYSEIGKRGYGESTGLREMMVGYPLGNQRIALQKYCSLFVTEGGPYPIPAHGEGAVFSLDSGFSGRVEMGVLNRPQAGFTPDIPPYSACSFQESCVIPSQNDYSIQVKTLELNPDLKKLEVVLGAGIPATAQVYLASKELVYTLTHNGTVWVTSSDPLPISAAFPVEYTSGWTQPAPAQFEKNLVAYLVQIATSTQIMSQYQYQYVTPAPDTQTPQTPPTAFEGGQVLVYCDAPAEFLPHEYAATGKVLFVSRVDPSMVTSAASTAVP